MNMHEMAIAPGIKMIVDTCAGIKPGEKVLIITDTGMDPAIIRAMLTMCVAKGAEVITTNMIQVPIPGMAPPSMVAAAAKEADVVLELTKQFIGASQCRIDACAAGARWLILCAMNPNLLKADGAVNVDYHAIRPVGEIVQKRFGEAKTFRLLAPNGTDLSGSIEGRPGRFHWGVANGPGVLASPPDIEVGTAPLEGTSNGVAYIDVMLLMGPEERMSIPVKVTFKDGLATSIEGPRAYILQDIIDACKDPNMYNLAEIALGLNPKARVSGIPVESESALGSAHIALGNNRGYFGNTDAKAHLDLVIDSVTLYLDDEMIMKDGKLLVGDPLK